MPEVVQDDLPDMADGDDDNNDEDEEWENFRPQIRERAEARDSECKVRDDQSSDADSDDNVNNNDDNKTPDDTTPVQQNIFVRIWNAILGFFAKIWLWFTKLF